MGRNVVIQKYKVNENMSVLPFIIVLSFILVGIIVGIIVYSIDYYSNEKYFKLTTAVITEIEVVERDDDDVSHYVYVDYVVAGKEYSHINLGSYSSSMYVGQEIAIEYDFRNPEKIHEKDQIYATYGVLGTMGAIILVIIIIMSQFTSYKLTQEKIDKYFERHRVKITSVIETQFTHNDRLVKSQDFTCKYNNVEYIQKYIVPNKDLVAGNTVDLYILKKEYIKSKRRIKVSQDYFIDLNTIQLSDNDI